MHSQISSGVNRIKRRRRGRNIVPRLAQGFRRLPSSAHPAVASSSRPAPGELVRCLVKFFFQISVSHPLSVAKVWRCAPAVVRKSLQKFSRARRNMQMSRNERLTSLEVSQQSVASGQLTKSLCATATVIFHLSLIVNVLHGLARSVLPLQVLLGIVLRSE